MSNASNRITSKLFEPFSIGSLQLRNRIVMAPMTRNRADDWSAPHAMTSEYYAQRASAGLIITEASQVSRQGTGYVRTPGIYSDKQIAGWQVVTNAVHAAGGRIFLQLWHVGRISHPVFQSDHKLPVAPSAIKPDGELFTDTGMRAYVSPRALLADEIPGIVEQFRQGAANAKLAGFDGVEVHAANGYLIDQFLRDGTNHRNDEWGGPPANRARFLFEVIEAVNAVWDSKRIGVRLSPCSSFNDMRDSNPTATFEYVAGQLSAFSLAYLHVVETRAVAFDWAGLRRRFAGTYMANEGYGLQDASLAIDTMHADLVSFGAPFIANPDLVGRFRAGAPLNQGHRASFYGGDAKGYIDYPTLEQSNAGSRGNLLDAAAE